MAGNIPTVILRFTHVVYEVNGCLLTGRKFDAADAAVAWQLVFIPICHEIRIINIGHSVTSILNSDIDMKLIVISIIPMPTAAGKYTVTWTCSVIIGIHLVKSSGDFVISGRIRTIRTRNRTSGAAASSQETTYQYCHKKQWTNFSFHDRTSIKYKKQDILVGKYNYWTTVISSVVVE